MTLTKKDPSITLSGGEQIELRRYMRHPTTPIGISRNEPLRRILVNSLVEKGYIKFSHSNERYDFYIVSEA